MSVPDSRISSPPRVLLVDDNEAGNKGLARYLEAQGYEVTTVLDGTSALQVLDSGPPPDFLLTDMRLPDLDGREVAQHASRLVPRPRVALITGWDIEPDARHEAWGIEWVFPKPVDVRELIAKLREPKKPT